MLATTSSRTSVLAATRSIRFVVELVEMAAALVVGAGADADADALAGCPALDVTPLAAGVLCGEGMELSLLIFMVKAFQVRLAKTVVESTAKHLPSKLLKQGFFS